MPDRSPAVHRLPGQLLTRTRLPRPRLLVTLVASALSTYAFGNPVGPQVISGSASIATAGKTLSITNSPNAIINWQGFSIAPSETTRFVQQGAQSAVLNRVVGADPSQILGTLQSNGRVFLINPNGILFGQGARVDVQGMVASTLNISDKDFLGNKLNFQAGAVAGKVENQGTIATPSGGQVYLIGSDVTNSGLITSPNGEVLLAAGKSVKLVDADDPNLRVEITAGGQAVNLGRIITEGGKAGIYAGVIQQNGTVRADSVVRGANGKITFRASGNVTLGKDSITSASGKTAGEISVTSDTGTLLVSGRVEASSDEGKGGTIKLLGKQVGLTEQAVVDASGKTGGGTILVGGDYQGNNPAVQNARATYVGNDVVVRANAIQAGDGGKVVVWADEITRFLGRIEAKGGAQGGDGGFVEVSGKHSLVFRGMVETTAPLGRAGTLLLDPGELTITDNATEDFSGASPSLTLTPTNGNWMFSDDPAPATITSGTVIAILNNTNVNFQSNGNITLQSNADILYANAGGGPRDFTLTAFESITLQSGANIRSTAGALNVTLNADNTASGNGTITATGAKILTNGGNIVLGGGGSPLTTGANAVTINSSATFNSAGGAISIRGANAGVLVQTSVAINAGSGNVTIVGATPRRVTFDLNRLYV